MILFNCDYTEGCCPEILEQIARTNMEQTVGYSEDEYCNKAAQLIRTECGNQDLKVHFLVSGTQTNFTVIDASLRPHQGVLAADTGHINVHETGAVEATGHKVLVLPSTDGKITASQINAYVENHFQDESFEHIVQPKMVYLSQPTELGTLYSLKELREISDICRKQNLILYVDGARMGYGLMSKKNDVSLKHLAELTDVFYIGGTKVGALFGEAVVIRNKAIAQDFRYLIKQHGGMFAKGRLLGIQFQTLFQDGLYYRGGEHGIQMADKIRTGLDDLRIPMLVNSPTNQIFPIFEDSLIESLAKDFGFSYQQRIDKEHSAIRFCTSWATKEENVDKLLNTIKTLLAGREEK